MHHRLIVHIVWATRGRDSAIDPDRERFLRDNLPVIARQERAVVLAMGIVTTHLHLLVRLHPTTALPRLLQRMKGGTAHALNEHLRPGQRQLRWAKGYSVTSVSPRALLPAADYVRNQCTRHPNEAINS